MKKSVRFAAAILIMLVVGSVFFCVPSLAAVAQKAYVNGENVNIRAGAGTSYTSLGKVTHDYITVTGRNGDWFSMTYNGKSGYMHANYVDFVPTAMEQCEGYVNHSAVKLREQASTARTILTSVSYATVTVKGIVYTGMDYPWYQVTYNGISGYMYGEYIDIIEKEPEYDYSADFEAQISAFPESYKPYLRNLHARYPNWQFRANNLTMSFDEAVKNEDIFPRKLVNLTSDGVSWRSMGKDSYNWTTGAWTNTEGGWTGASTEVIKYYMDPRNFLNKDDVYMFLQQGYDSSQTIDGINTIIANTFLAKGYSDPADTAYGGSYAKVILEAAKQSGVSAYVLASTIILEQGVNGTSGLISGTTSHGKYYNFFNVKATGSTDADILANGLSYAKSQGWSTRSAAIIGGAKFYAKGYITSGQDTCFYKNFDLVTAPYYTHQYAQSIYDSRSSARLIRSSYASNYSAPLIFKIPVYASIPETVAEKPAENDLKNNYYLLSMSVSGFSMYNYNYSLSVSGDTTVSVTLPSGASLANNKPYRLKSGTNNVEIKVKAETGYTNSYYLTVTASKECILVVSPCAAHSFTAKNNNYLKSPADCTTPAQYYYECSVCGAKGSTAYELGSALGHSHSTEWTVDIPAGNYSEGSRSRHCVLCGDKTDIEPIPSVVPVNVNTLVSVAQQLIIVSSDINIDVNNDGVVNTVDLISLKKLAASGAVEQSVVDSAQHYLFVTSGGVNADVDENGTVNILDLIKLKKLLANS